jgi:hypothetical protein
MFPLAEISAVRWPSDGDRARQGHVVYLRAPDRLVSHAHVARELWAVCNCWSGDSRVFPKRFKPYPTSHSDYWRGSHRQCKECDAFQQISFIWRTPGRAFHLLVSILQLAHDGHPKLAITPWHTRKRMPERDSEHYRFTIIGTRLLSDEILLLRWLPDATKRNASVWLRSLPWASADSIYSLFDFWPIQ